MTDISAAARQLRESSRQDNGEFGEHAHSNPELTLGGGAWPEDLGRTHFTGQWGQVDVPEGSRTPWGPAQRASREADGIAFVPTDGHGGYKLSSERNAAVPRPFRKASGWYEEDCERHIVEFYHYDALFNRPQDAGRDRAADLAGHDESLRDWFPKAWEKVNGRTLEPGESREKDQQTWANDNADRYVMTSQQRTDDGRVLVTAERRSTGDRDTFLMTVAERDEAREEAAGEYGAAPRFRVPEGATPQPRPEPAPVKPGYTGIPDTSSLTAAAAAKVTADLNQRWRLAGDEVLTLRQQIERGDVTGKCVVVSDTGTRNFYLEKDGTGTVIKVSKATFDAFEAPDTRTARDKAMEAVQIANAKLDTAQRAVDAAFRPTAAQYAKVRDAHAAVKAAREALAQEG